MLRIQFGLIGSVVSLCSVLGCSAGPAPGSQTNPRASGGAGNAPGDGSGNAGSGNAPNVGSGGAGPSINTDSGEVMDAGDCGSTLDVLYRDFNESHPDFEMPFAGDVVRRGLIEVTLGADQKPVFKERVGHPSAHGQPDRHQRGLEPDAAGHHQRRLVQAVVQYLGRQSRHPEKVGADGVGARHGDLRLRQQRVLPTRPKRGLRYHAQGQ